MITRQTRRRFLAALSMAGAAGFLRTPPAQAAEDPPETTTVRLIKGSICGAPQNVAKELLRAEGFTDIRYVDVPPTLATPLAVARGEVDFSLVYASLSVQAIDAGDPIAVLAGVHVGCQELLGNDSIRGIADLKGKSVGVQALGSTPHVLLTLIAAQIGLDPAQGHPLGHRPVGQTDRAFRRRQDRCLLGLSA